MLIKKIEEKKHRLIREFYLGERTVAFTLCIYNKHKLFTDWNIYSVFNNILLEEMLRFDFDSPVYLFMPNHLHLITTGKKEKSDCLELIKLFKQKTGYWLSENTKDIRWQKNYYDHIIRDENDIGNQVMYILQNPVRAGLVNDRKEYKFKGSTVYNFNEWD